MLNINFVPDDYIQSSKSQKTNFLFLILFSVVMTGLGGIFFTIKMRQRALNIRERHVNKRIADAQESIKQLEQLQTKRKEMMKTALTTSELIEPVPRSVLLAFLTNNLPPGTSLLNLEVVQKKPANQRYTKRGTTKYQTTKAQNNAEDNENQYISPEKLLDTYIDIEGIAPSDFDVATYIERLSESKIMNNVALVESKEFRDIRKGQIKEEAGPVLRQFKLTSFLGKGVHLSKADIEFIREAYEKQKPYAF